MTQKQKAKDRLTRKNTSISILLDSSKLRTQLDDLLERLARISDWESLRGLKSRITRLYNNTLQFGEELSGLEERIIANGGQFLLFEGLKDDFVMLSDAIRREKEFLQELE